jgi:HSP20 family protein
MSKRKKLGLVRDVLFPEGRLIRDLSRSALRVLEPPSVPLDMFERDGSVVVRAELAGVGPEDVDVVVVNGELRISGEREDEESISEDLLLHSERSHGRIYRSVELPEGADVEGIRATMKNGVLEVVIPTDRSASTRKVPVTQSE